MPPIKAKTVSGTHKAVRVKTNRMVIPIKELLPRDLSSISHIPTSYPLDAPARAAFRTHDGKKLTEYQWAVYEFARTIPRGRVTTYAALSKAIGRGSPRSVGSALRHNPFAPFVPCHRVIASNLYIGGFFGEWGMVSSGKKGDASRTHCQRKIELLAMEGVEFTIDGYLADESLIWRG